MRKSFKWNIELPPVKSYAQMVAESYLAINGVLCSCEANRENAKTFLNNGDENLLNVENKTNCKCGGTGIILET